MNNKIAITTTSFAMNDPAPLKELEMRGFVPILNHYGRKLTEKELLCLIEQEKPIGLIAGTEPITEKVLRASADFLKVISRAGTGWDNIDHKSANDLGIKVYRTPDAPTQAVAELTVGLILNLLRKVNHMDQGLRNGKWEKHMGNLIQAKNIGIIGFGRIGQNVARLLSSFDVKIAYYDIERKDSSVMYEMKSFESILCWADILTLHMSHSAECSPIIGIRELRLMKKGSWFINVSRGGIVDEEALYTILKDGHLAGAALDVFEKEPYVGPLSTLENVILTPHIGSYAVEARNRMEMDAVKNLIEGLRHYKTIDS